MKTQLTINLKKELKKDFSDKVLNESNFSGVSEALTNLIEDFLISKNNIVLDSNNKFKKMNNFYIDEDLKKELKEFIDNTKEFNNTTDLITKIIYNYTNK